MCFLFFYSGDYGDAMDLGFLKNFHRRRVKVLADSGPDLIAFETVPNKLEAQVLKFCCPSHLVLLSQIGRN